MSPWTDDELNKIGAAEELRIAALRQDGTLRKPKTIWVVRVGDDLYVRSAYGLNAAWFRGTQVRHEGRIWAGGIEKDVSFVDVDRDSDIHDQIDAEYRAKYRRYPEGFVRPVVSAESRTVTLKLVPRSPRD
ncbi:MAG TPA: DUF2255 family protein [Chloroflexia bacterium]|nr:DUF2255 family protein [Chloroflexia bacterium]